MWLKDSLRLSKLLKGDFGGCCIFFLEIYHFLVNIYFTYIDRLSYIVLYSSNMKRIKMRRGYYEIIYLIWEIGSKVN
jgi:hypothetical protein